MLTNIPNSIIRDNIEGNRLISVNHHIRSIIDTPAFQRLRYIKQLGLACYVFPTADHSRFSHSLGSYATALSAFTNLKHRSTEILSTLSPISFDQHTEDDFLTTALLHDIGHSAFSHVLEGILLPNGLKNHEDCTRLLILEDSKLRTAIKNFCDIDSVMLLLENRHANRALNSLISSPFDIDRCDYILRDSAMTGVKYGTFDLAWLIHSITVDTNDYGQPVLILDGPRGLDALRQFFSARRYLHRHVYFHCSIRGIQIILKSIFERMRDIYDHADNMKYSPSCFHDIFRNEAVSVGNFLEIDDATVFSMISEFAKLHSDTVLRYLCQNLLNRNIPKAIIDTAKISDEKFKKFDFVERSSGIQADFFGNGPILASEITKDLTEFVRERFDKNGYPPDAVDYIVSLDRSLFSSIPPSDMMFHFDGDTYSFDRLPKLSSAFSLKSVLEEFSLFRVYCPREFAREAKERVSRRLAS